MVMRSMRDGASGGVFKYFLFALLGMSVGGLVVMDVRGVLGGVNNVGGSDVARVAGDSIDLQSFHRTVQRSLQNYQVTPEQAYKIGLTEEILTGEIRRHFLLHEARKIGLVLDKDLLATRVAEIVKPQVRPGQSMQDALEQLLKYQGMSETDFLETMKKEVSSELVMNPIRIALKPDMKALAQDLYQFQNQSRNIEYIAFLDSDVVGVEPATEEQLRTLYDSVKAIQFKIPEYRTVQTAVFDPDSVELNVTIEESELRKYYDNNTDKFNIGEQLLLTQALLDDEEQATQIYKLTREGKSLHDAAIEVVGPDVKYFEKSSFESTAMLPNLMDAVEKAGVNGITPPTKTTLGYHVVRLDEIIAPSVQPFEQVEAQIGQILSDEKRNDVLYKISEDLDERLDRGESFEDIAKEVTITVSSYGPVDNKGLNSDGGEALSDFQLGDKKTVIDLTYELEKGEVSLLQEMSDGKFVAFKLINSQAEGFKPFSEVKDELAVQYLSDQRHADNAVKLRKFMAELETGGSSFDSIVADTRKSKETIADIKVQAEVPLPLTKAVAPKIFEADIGETILLDLDDKFLLAKISGYSVPDVTDIPQEQMDTLVQTLNREQEDEVFLMYVRDLGQHYDVSVNNRLLDSVYGQKQDESQ